MKNRFLMAISMMLLLPAAVLLTSCKGSGEETKYHYQIYNINKQETSIFTVEYGTNQSQMEAVVDELVEQMSIMPGRLEYIPPLANHFQLIDYEISDKQITLRVDEKYKELPVITEVLVRAALVRTLTQVEGIDYVSMKIRFDPLTDASGNLVGAMSPDMFIDNTGDEINTYEKVRLKLYYANESGDELVEMQRTVVYSSNISLERLVVEELIKGPQLNEKGFPTINKDTKVVSVTVKDGTCYVNFDKTFLIHYYTVNASITIYSIVNSLVELSNINKVQISINGDTNINYRDTLALSTMFERNLEIIQ